MRSDKLVTNKYAKRPPSRTPDAEEKRLVGLANKLAAAQLEEGTASSQVITHFLKVGSATAQLEKEILREEIKLKRAKTELLQGAKRIEALYADAITAMRTYAGAPSDDEQS